MTACAGAWQRSRIASWSRWTTGSRPSIASPPRWTMPSMRSAGCGARHRRSASTPTGSRWGATAPAARWRRPARCWRATAAGPLALQLLLYPGLADTQQTRSHRAYAKGYLLDADLIQWFFSHYLRGPDDRRDWRFAPLVHPDLRGVAPAWMALAELDPLVD